MAGKLVFVAPVNAERLRLERAPEEPISEPERKGLVRLAQKLTEEEHDDFENYIQKLEYQFPTPFLVFGGIASNVHALSMRDISHFMEYWYTRNPRQAKDFPTALFFFDMNETGFTERISTIPMPLEKYKFLFVFQQFPPLADLPPRIVLHVLYIHRDGLSRISYDWCPIGGGPALCRMDEPIAWHLIANRLRLLYDGTQHATRPTLQIIKSLLNPQHSAPIPQTDIRFSMACTHQNIALLAAWTAIVHLQDRSPMSFLSPENVDLYRLDMLLTLTGASKSTPRTLDSYLDQLSKFGNSIKKKKEHLMYLNADERRQFSIPMNSDLATRTSVPSERSETLVISPLITKRGTEAEMLRRKRKEMVIELSNPEIGFFVRPPIIAFIYPDTLTSSEYTYTRGLVQAYWMTVSGHDKNAILIHCAVGTDFFPFRLCNVIMFVATQKNKGAAILLAPRILWSRSPAFHFFRPARDFIKGMYMYVSLYNAEIRLYTEMPHTWPYPNHLQRDLQIIPAYADPVYLLRDMTEIDNVYRMHHIEVTDVQKIPMMAVLSPRVKENRDACATLPILGSIYTTLFFRDIIKSMFQETSHNLPMIAGINSEKGTEKEFSEMDIVFFPFFCCDSPPTIAVVSDKPDDYAWIRIRNRNLLRAFKNFVKQHLAVKERRVQPIMVLLPFMMSLQKEDISRKLLENECYQRLHAIAAPKYQQVFAFPLLHVMQRDNPSRPPIIDPVSSARFIGFIERQLPLLQRMTMHLDPLIQGYRTIEEKDTCVVELCHNATMPVPPKTHEPLNKSKISTLPGKHLFGHKPVLIPTRVDGPHVYWIFRHFHTRTTTTDFTDEKRIEQLRTFSDNHPRYTILNEKDARAIEIREQDIVCNIVEERSLPALNAIPERRIGCRNFLVVIPLDRSHLLPNECSLKEGEVFFTQCQHPAYPAIHTAIWYPHLLKTDISSTDADHYFAQMNLNLMYMQRHINLALDSPWAKQPAPSIKFLRKSEYLSTDVFHGSIRRIPRKSYPDPLRDALYLQLVNETWRSLSTDNKHYNFSNGDDAHYKIHFGTMIDMAVDRAHKPDPMHEENQRSIKENKLVDEENEMSMHTNDRLHIYQHAFMVDDTNYYNTPEVYFIKDWKTNKWLPVSPSAHPKFTHHVPEKFMVRVAFKPGDYVLDGISLRELPITEKHHRTGRSAWIEPIFTESTPGVRQQFAARRKKAPRVFFCTLKEMHRQAKRIKTYETITGRAPLIINVFYPIGIIYNRQTMTTIAELQKIFRL